MLSGTETKKKLNREAILPVFVQVVNHHVGRGRQAGLSSQDADPPVYIQQSHQRIGHIGQGAGQENLPGGGHIFRRDIPFKLFRSLAFSTINSFVYQTHKICYSTSWYAGTCSLPLSWERSLISTDQFTSI
jgi:hypothetical protein